MRRYVFVAMICGLVATVALGSAGAAQVSRQSRLQQALDRFVASGFPGAVLVVRESGRTYRLASGISERSRRTPMRVGDRFRVGSVTKTFVATVILQLVAEGDLSLEDTVEERLPGLVPRGERITIRQLLGHTAGLFDYLNDAQVLQPYLAGNFGRVWRPRALVARAVAHKPLFPPGTRFQYCNTCYLLLGLIVEEASGRSLAAELDRRIVRPLRLRGTSLPSSPRIIGAHAHGYSKQLGSQTAQDVTAISPTVTWAAGGLVSTADDLAVFYRALLGGRLLRPDLLRAMETRVRISPLDEYGLGLWRTRGLALLTPAQRLRCSAFWGHNGDWVGYHADAFVTKDLSRQVVLLVNGDVEGQPGPAFAPLAQLAYCG